MINENDQQISTQAFLKSVFTFFINLANKWQIILIALLIGTCFDLVKNTFFKKPPVYNGKISFHLELDGSAGGGANQLGGLASSFGLPGMAPAGGGDLFGAANFEAIVLSVSNFQHALMKEVKIGNRTDLFINYYIDSSDIKTNEWAGSLIKSASPFMDFKFTKKKPEDFTPYENMAFAEVYNKLAPDTRVDPQDNSSLVDLVAGTTNENLTKIWLETLMETTEEFYKNMKTKKTRQLLKIQEKRLDSLTYLVKNTDRKLARITFDNPNVVDPQGIVQQQKVNRDNTYITNQYFTQLANVESLNRLIFEQTPIFHVLEPVRLPLEVIEKTGVSTRLGGIICLFAAILIISLVKSFKEIMGDLN
jgi:hypothetical protein